MKKIFSIILITAIISVSFSVFASDTIIYRWLSYGKIANLQISGQAVDVYKFNDGATSCYVSVTLGSYNQSLSCVR